MTKRIIYDLETMKNLFTACFLGLDTCTKKQFVLFNDKQEYTNLLSFLDSCKDDKYTFVGFNNLYFDAQVIEFILSNRVKFDKLTCEEIVTEIYNKVQWIIALDDKAKYKSLLPEWKLSIPQIDLYLINHYNNKNKRTSLKWLEFTMQTDNIEEMPIHHATSITQEDIPEILSYNWHDVEATHEFYKINIGETDNILYKGVNKLQLREDIKTEFNINCFNYNDVKIGDALNKQSYCNISDISSQEISESNKVINAFKFKDCFPDYYKFKTKEFNDFVNSFGNIDVKLDKSEDKQIFEFGYNGTIYTIAKGGIHSVDGPRLIKVESNQIMRDADIGSQYPRAIIKRKLYPKHLGENWLEGYNNIFERRIKAKREGNKSINEAYKLALNGGGYGKLGEEYNWQYDPFCMYSCTIGNQIEILMLIESLELEGIHVISANTDGIVCLFDKQQEELYYKVCKQWEVQVGNNEFGQLEYTDYSLFVQTSVNDYLAVKTNGKYKVKGDFEIDKELHKNTGNNIIPKVLMEYFINGVDYRKYITKADNNILDFCKGLKVKSDFNANLHYVSQGQPKSDPGQRVTRYYVSTNGGNLIKEYKESGKKIGVEAGWKCTLLNKIKEPLAIKYPINYSYYIKCAEKIIHSIEGDKNQLNLF